MPCVLARCAGGCGVLGHGEAVEELGGIGIMSLYSLLFPVFPSTDFGFWAYLSSFLKGHGPDNVYYTADNPATKEMQNTINVARIRSCLLYTSRCV